MARSRRRQVGAIGIPRGDGGRLWDSLSGEDLLYLPETAAFASRFSPDGRSLVSLKDRPTIWTIGAPDEVARIDRADRANELRAQRSREAAEAREQKLRQARQNDEGCIKRWLVAAPIPIADATSISARDEATLAPRAGDASPARAGLTWKELLLPDHEIDLKAFSGGNSPDSVGFLVAYLISDTEQTGVRMLVGSDDQAKVYLNGEPVYESSFNRSFLADEDVVEPLQLRAGVNVVVFKVINEGSDWKGSLRFTDSAGAPLPGIRVSSSAPR